MHDDDGYSRGIGGEDSEEGREMQCEFLAGDAVCHWDDEVEEGVDSGLGFLPGIERRRPLSFLCPSDSFKYSCGRVRLDSPVASLPVSDGTDEPHSSNAPILDVLAAVLQCRFGNGSSGVQIQVIYFFLGQGEGERRQAGNAVWWLREVARSKSYFWDKNKCLLLSFRSERYFKEPIKAFLKL